MDDTLTNAYVACTLRGSVLVVATFFLAPLLRRWLGANGVHWMWVAALLAFLCPFPPRTALSVQNYWSNPATKFTQPVSPAIDDTPVVVRLERDTLVPEISRETPVRSANSMPQVKLHSQSKTDPTLLVFTIWIAGTVILLIQLAWRWTGTLRLLRSANPVEDERWTGLLERLKISRKIRLLETSDLRAPALAGLWRPKILIPAGWLTEVPDDELESILLHELGHDARRDLMWEWLFSINRCLHWINPLAWWAAHAARDERELACDAWAVRRCNAPTLYGRALLGALERVQAGRYRGFGAVAMAQSSHQIARRLRNIILHRSGKVDLSRLAWLPASVLLLIFGTNRLVAESSSPPQEALPPVTKKAAAEVTTPLPLARRSVSIITSLVRVPEALAGQFSLPIAQEGSKGISVVYSRSDYKALVNRLKNAPGVKIESTPVVVARNNRSAFFQAAKEFRFPSGYRADSPHQSVPEPTEAFDLGMYVQLKPSIQSETTVLLNIQSTLAYLMGFKDENGSLVAASPPAEGSIWLDRFTSWQMPPGAKGEPALEDQRSDLSVNLATDQVALTHGFRDASLGVKMVNYFVVRLEILP